MIAEAGCAGHAALRGKAPRDIVARRKTVFEECMIGVAQDGLPASGKIL